jgi:hypothetical protein
MKKIEQIRENYDLITEKDESDTRKLTSLVRAGLFDQSKLPLLKRALQKDPSKLTMAERKALLDLLDSLMSEVLHSNQVYSKVKQSVMSDKDLHEEVGNLVSPIDGKQSRPLSSKIDLPYMLIMKRKAVRVYPGNERVGLYYIQALDRYITVPFGPGVSNMNEGVDWQGAAKSVDSYSGSLRNRVFGKPASGNSSKFKKYAETNPEKVSRKYYSNPDDAEHKELAKKAQGTLSNQPLSIRAGFAVGQALRGAFGAHTSKDNTPKQSKEAPKKVSAPRSQGPWGQRPTQTTPKVTQKPAKVSAPTSAPKVSAPKMASVSGSATGNFGGSMSAPMTAKASAPKAAKPSREEKRIAKLPGMGAQPKTGDFPQADKKVKTFSTNTQLTQARDLTPLEKKTGTVNPEKQLPRKRYAGIDPKVPGTGPQPSVGKLKAPGKRMMAKLEEKRQVNEVAQVIVPALGAAATVAGAAGIAQHIYRNKGDIGGAIQKGIETGKQNFTGNLKKIKDTFSTPAPATKKKVNPGNVMAKAAKDDFDASQKTSSSEFSKLDHVDTPAKAEPAKIDAATTTVKEPPAVVTPPADVIAAPKPQTDADTGIKTAAVAGGATLAGAAASSAANARTQAKAQAKAKADTATKAKTEKGKPGRGRPKFSLPPPDFGGKGDDTKSLSPGNFNLKAHLVEPKGDVQTGFNKRAENDYRKSLKMSEDANSAPTISRSSPVSFKMSTKLISPGRKSVVTGYDKKAENDYRNSLREDVFTTLKDMINNNVTEMQLNIGENTIKINNTIATKIVNVHETLNEDNQKKMRDMLNEGDVSSFKKILDFAVRQ